MPAAAVRQEGQALFGIIWSKKSVGGLNRLIVISFSLKEKIAIKTIKLWVKEGKIEFLGYEWNW